MPITCVCPNCRHKTCAQPLTGTCPECGVYSFSWNVVDREGFVRLLRIRMCFNLLMACIFLIAAFFLFDAGSGPSSTSSGGKSGLFLIIYTALHALLSPIFGAHAASLVCLALSVPFFFLAIRKYKRLRAPYNSHNPADM